MVELLPCPFGHHFSPKYQGSPTQLLPYRQGRDDTYVVMCGCGAVGPEQPNKELAVAAWNTRSTPPLPEVEVERVARAIDPAWWDWHDAHFMPDFPRDKAQKGMRLEAARAAISACTGVPEGWRLVPIEPTPEMIDRFVSRALCVSVHGDGGWSEYARKQYAAMLSAAPKGGE